MTTRLLVTGFGPFPSMPRNPSAALARAVAASPRWHLHDVAARAVILTTAYAALRAELDPALAAGADAVLMIGVAGRARTIRVETRATGRRSTLFADVAGETADAEAARASPSARRTRVGTTEALRALRRRGVPARLSRDAGRYLCNAAYLRALARPAPTLFVHVPKPAGRARPARTKPHGVGPAGARLAAALVEIGLGMVRDARRVAGRPALR